MTDSKKINSEKVESQNKRLKFWDLEWWMIIFSESYRARFQVNGFFQKNNPNNTNTKYVSLTDRTKYWEWQFSGDYSESEINDNFFIKSE